MLFLSDFFSSKSIKLSLFNFIKFIINLEAFKIHSTLFIFGFCKNSSLYMPQTVAYWIGSTTYWSLKLYFRRLWPSDSQKFSGAKYSNVFMDHCLSENK